MQKFYRSSVLLAALLTAINATADIPRTADGKPDLSGFFDVATITPMERSKELGETMSITPEEALKMEREREERRIAAAQRSDPDREAPPVGGSVGGYNAFWLDAGENRFMVNGEYRTSILTTPANGRRPELISEWGKQEAKALLDDFRYINLY